MEERRLKPRNSAGNGRQVRKLKDFSDGSSTSRTVKNVLSLLGGVAGAVLGLMLSWALCAYMAAAFVISPGAIALGVGFSAAVGIVFGWAPARRASALDPIDALRSM